MKEIIFIPLILILLSNLSLGNECISRNYGNGGTVCVCNSTYCDTLNAVESIPQGEFVVYTSNKAGLRFKSNNGSLSKQCDGSAVKISIDSETTYQSIHGWGGTFTDATGININSLNGKTREFLMRSYFASEGLQYSLCRVPMAGTDFSTRPYTYDDIKGDGTLANFNLTFEDYEYKIPLMQEALALRNGNLKFFATPWTAPPWMKTVNKYEDGFLKTQYYQQWANYYIKFFEAYKNENITFWGLTTGNEALDGIIPDMKIVSMGWLPSAQAKWISKNLGPAIRNSNFKDIKIITLDDQRVFLPWVISLMFLNKDAKKYVDGIAVHWYFDKYAPATTLDWTHNLFPDKFILASEACSGNTYDSTLSTGFTYDTKPTIILGSWDRGENYTKDIIDDVNHWITGWIDWNLALNEEGGPNYIKNFVDSPIIVNATAQEFYKQPMYYVLGHFSKFIPPQSYRIKSNVTGNRLKVTSFVRPDNLTALVIYNGEDQDIEVCVTDTKKGSFELSVSQHSINTVLY